MIVKHRHLIPAIMIAVLIATTTCAASFLKSENWPVPAGLEEYAVLRVIDGDTIEVENLG